MNLNEFLDFHYGSDGDQRLKGQLENGKDPNEKLGHHQETALHVAARRRRLGAVEILLAHGVDIDATNNAGKTAFAHAKRRGFEEIAHCLAEAGCDQHLNDADQFAMAVGSNQLEEARAILAKNPTVIKTGNPEEDRLLADIAGRDALDAVKFLVENGADLTVPGLDDGTPLHIAAWFGQPKQVQCLLQAGAPCDIFDSVHQSSPLGWAVHGSQHSGGAAARQANYVALVRHLLEGGATYQTDETNPEDPLWQYLLREASPEVRKTLKSFAERKKTP